MTNSFVTEFAESIVLLQINFRGMSEEVKRPELFCSSPMSWKWVKQTSGKEVHFNLQPHPKKHLISNRYKSILISVRMACSSPTVHREIMSALHTDLRNSATCCTT